MSRNTPIKLRIPRQDLEDFKFFGLSADAAQEWAQNLPVANTLAVAQQLRDVITALNRIALAPEVRYEIMEVLRPILSVALPNLSRHYLNQSLVMPEEPRQMAALADSLNSASCTAYTIVAVHALQQRDSIRHTSPARLLGEAIHRAVGFAGARLLLAYQLYRPVELNGWLTLHQLYALAEAQQLTRLPVSDPLSVESSISSAYLQALLLACCKPNQMRQSDLATIYGGLQQWTPMMEIAPDEHGQGLFLVDLDTDQPPLYSSVYSDAPGPKTRYIDTGPLVDHLEDLRAGAESGGIELDRKQVISIHLLDQLINFLGSMSKRNFTRTKIGKPMWVSIGLSATHYHLAGERDFEQVMYGNDYMPSASDLVEPNPFLARNATRDMWQRANPEEDFSEQDIPEEDFAMEHQVFLDDETRAVLEGEEEEGTPLREQYPVHQVSMVNISPGGYCFEWSPELPEDIKTGDIVSVRELPDGSWAIAVIRWLSQLKNAKTLIGLELLSPRAQPYGARMQRKKGGETEQMRVLLLPEIKLVGQPHTLITPRAGFAERQKIILTRQGEEFYIQLLRQVAITGSFAQFDFRYIKQLGEVLAEDKTRPQDSSFDSLWTNI
jgi:cyclic-di-GMP-binding protein